MSSKEAKTYVLDTSVLIHSPAALLAFEENTVIVPFSVLEALGKLKTRPGEVGANAKECNRILSALCDTSNASISKGIATPNGGLIRVEGELEQDAIYIAKVYSSNAVLVTLDENQRVRANVAGVKAESYKHGQVNIKNGGYTGRASVMVPSKTMSEYASKGELPIYSAVAIYDAHGEIKELFENQFVIIRDASDPSHTMLGRFTDGKIVKLRYIANSPVFGVTPRNVGQRFALEALLAPASEAPLVILNGPAGTAKTFLAMAAGLEQTYEHSRYSRILVSRPNTKFDDDIGYLKGDEQEKIGPLIRPVMDNLSNLMNTTRNDNTKDGQRMADPSKELFDSGVIVAQAMAYMRGRSICENYIVIDEAQNATANQILGLITRVGENSKIVILGDPDQIDHPYLDRLSNGLSYASEHMKGSPLCWQLSFEESECTRSNLAAEAIARLTQG